MEANVESHRGLRQNLQSQGYDLRSIPYVLQLNKRDSPTAVPVHEMLETLRIGDEPVVEAIAHSDEGVGVFETLKAVSKLVLQDLTKVSDTRDSAACGQGGSPGTISSPAAPTVPLLVRADARPQQPAPTPRVTSVAERRESKGGGDTFAGTTNVPFDIGFDSRYGSLLHDLLGVLQFPFAFLVASGLFLDPRATQYLAVNAAYWVMGFAGALWIRYRNERRQIFDAWSYTAVE
jgi:hypothetical protein